MLRDRVAATPRQEEPQTADRSAPHAMPAPAVHPPRSLKQLLHSLELAIVPETTPHDEAVPDDYRRVVLLIAALAVGFFVPSLLVAGVPQHLWLPFAGLAVVAGLILAGSFTLVRRGSRLLALWVLADAAVTAALGVAYGPYYHEIDLLYSLLVAAHAVVHGLAPALLLAGLGSVIVPFVIEGHGAVNGTDPVYAGIYFLGAALIPWVAGRVARRRLLEVRRHLRAVVATEREAVGMLARASEAKDDVTGEHVLRVGDLAARLATAVGESADFVEDLRFAAMLHDVGKLHVPDSILTKPGPLDAEEWAIVRRHTIWGERILGGMAGFERARRVARSHHENWDGSGYPDGLLGAAIPFEARIVHIVDVFDAMRTVRAYKAGWPIERCLEELERGSGTMFDPELVREFLRLVDGDGLARIVTSQVEFAPFAGRLDRVAQPLQDSVAG